MRKGQKKRVYQFNMKNSTICIGKRPKKFQLLRAYAILSYAPRPFGGERLLQQSAAFWGNRGLVIFRKTPPGRNSDKKQGGLRPPVSGAPQRKQPGIGKTIKS